MSNENDDSYDSDVSIPVFHPILDEVEVTDGEAEPEVEPEAEPEVEPEVEPEAEPEAEPEVHSLNPEIAQPSSPQQNSDSSESSRPQRKCAIIATQNLITKKLIVKKRVKVLVKSLESPKISEEIARTRADLEWYHRNKIVVPQFAYPILLPSSVSCKYWKESPFTDKFLPLYEPVDYEEALEKFRSLRNGVNLPHSSTLIVGDSILASYDFEAKLDSTVSVMITFPHKAIDFANHFAQKFKINADDFTFRNIVVALGIEFVCYDPDSKAAITATREFVIELLETFHYCFKSKPNVQFILLTLPHVKCDPTTIAYTEDIKYYNENIRKFVNKYEDEIKEKWNIDFRLFDWEKSTEMFRECSVEHVSERYEILVNEISKFTMVTDQ